MLVIGRELRRNRVAFGQPAADPGILAGDQVDTGQGLQRPQRDVAEIADGRGDQMQAGNRLGRGQDMARNGKTSGRRTRLVFRPVY